jgi:hypothetical protein
MSARRRSVGESRSAGGRRRVIEEVSTREASQGGPRGHIPPDGSSLRRSPVRLLRTDDPARTGAVRRSGGRGREGPAPSVVASHRTTEPPRPRGP